MGIDFKRPEKLGLFRCRLCEKAFNNIAQAQVHLGSKTHNQKIQKRTARRDPSSSPDPPFECVQCSLSFETYDDLKAHSDTVNHAPLKVPVVLARIRSIGTG